VTVIKAGIQWLALVPHPSNAKFVSLKGKRE
jgi:hypothetical protein